MALDSETVGKELERLRENEVSARERAAYHNEQRNFWLDQAARTSLRIVELERQRRLSQ